MNRGKPRKFCYGSKQVGEPNGGSVSMDESQNSSRHGLRRNKLFWCAGVDSCGVANPARARNRAHLEHLRWGGDFMVIGQNKLRGPCVVKCQPAQRDRDIQRNGACTCDGCATENSHARFPVITRATTRTRGHRARWVGALCGGGRVRSGPLRRCVWAGSGGYGV